MAERRAVCEVYRCLVCGAIFKIFRSRRRGRRKGHRKHLFCSCRQTETAHVRIG